MTEYESEFFCRKNEKPKAKKGEVYCCIKEELFGFVSPSDIEINGVKLISILKRLEEQDKRINELEKNVVTLARALKSK